MTDDLPKLRPIDYPLAAAEPHPFNGKGTIHCRTYVGETRCGLWYGAKVHDVPVTPPAPTRPSPTHGILERHPLRDRDRGEPERRELSTSTLVAYAVVVTALVGFLIAAALAAR